MPELFFKSKGGERRDGGRGKNGGKRGGKEEGEHNIMKVSCVHMCADVCTRVH